MFVTPFERLFTEAQKLSEFPSMFLSLQQNGQIQDITKSVFEIYRNHHDYLMSNNFNGNINQVESYIRLKDFKDHLKLAVDIIVEDVFQNFQSYLVNQQSVNGFNQQQCCQYQLDNNENVQSMKDLRSTDNEVNLQKPITHERRNTCIYQKKSQMMFPVSPSGAMTTQNSTPMGNYSLIQNEQYNTLSQLQTNVPSPSSQQQNEKIYMQQQYQEQPIIDHHQRIKSNQSLKMMQNITNQPNTSKLSKYVQHSISQIEKKSSQQKQSINLMKKLQVTQDQSKAFRNSQHNPYIMKKNLNKSQQECMTSQHYPNHHSHHQSLHEQEDFKGRQKTDYYNNLVYSSFQHVKGPQSFRKQDRFSKERETSPGPGQYLTLPDSQNQFLVGAATFYKAKRETSSDEKSLSPGVGQYNPKYHLIS